MLTQGSVFPPGTTVDQQTGVFLGNDEGILPGTYQFSMTVSDGLSMASGFFTFRVSSASDICPKAVLQTLTNVFTLPDAKAGSAYGVSLYVDGGAPPYSWSLSPGSTLPPGLEIDLVRGVLWGTPSSSAAGQTFTFSIKISDSEIPSQSVTGTVKLAVTS